MKVSYVETTSYNDTDICKAVTVHVVIVFPLSLLAKIATEIPRCKHLTTQTSFHFLPTKVFLFHVHL